MTSTEEKKYPMDQSLEEHIAQIIDQEIFYPPNLTDDEQLRSNIDSNGFMPLRFITENRHIKTLTTNLDRVVRGIQLSKSIQMSEDGRRIKVDLHPRRNTLILRNQPDNATQKDIERIFLDDPNCARCREVRPDISNTWFVTFDTEEECMQTVRYLQNVKKLSVGMKNAVNPLADISDKHAHQATSPTGGPSVQPPVDILASATIPTGTATSPQEYYSSPPTHGYEEPDVMSHYRNPYAPYYMNAPLMDVAPSPPMGIPQSPPQRAGYAPRLDIAQVPTQVPPGDYSSKFLLYRRNDMVDVYQTLLAENKLFRPENMNADLACVRDNLQESTMVQQPKETQRKSQNNRNSRRSPRGRSNRGRGDRRDRDRDRDRERDRDLDYDAPVFYDESYQDQRDYNYPPIQDFAAWNDDAGYDDFDEPLEQRNRGRSGGQRKKRQGRGGGRGRGRGRGKNQPRRNRPVRREYRPVGASEPTGQREDVSQQNGSTPKKGRSSPNRRASGRGRQKQLVYRPVVR